MVVSRNDGHDGDVFATNYFENVKGWDTKVMPEVESLDGRTMSGELEAFVDSMYSGAPRQLPLIFVHTFHELLCTVAGGEELISFIAGKGERRRLHPSILILLNHHPVIGLKSALRPH